MRDFGTLNNPTKFVDELGNLHDARIQRIEWQPTKRTLNFLIDDLYSNTVDLPEYPGEFPAKISLIEIVKLSLNFDGKDEYLCIDNFNVTQLESYIEIHINFWGGNELEAKCSSISIENLE